MNCCRASTSGWVMGLPSVVISPLACATPSLTLEKVRSSPETLLIIGLAKLAATMVDFDPRFEVMPGTHGKAEVVAHANPYEAVPEKIIAE